MIAFARRHWLFLAVLVVGTTLRVLTWVAYRPAFFYSDSVDYLKNTGHWPGTSWHPPGYPFVLDLLLIGHHLAVVTAVQHLLVLGVAVAIYVLLLRLGCHRIVAALAALPVLLDAYQLDIEQYILAEAVFEAFVVAAVVVLLWPGHRMTLRSVVAAFLLGFACLIRLDAVGLAVPFLGYLAWIAHRRRRASGDVSWFAAWRPLPIGVLILALPIVGLTIARNAGGHGHGLTGEGAIWTYGRVAPFANCRVDGIPAGERQLCPTENQQANHGSVWFENATDSPVRIYLSQHPGDSKPVENFARRVILHQPFAYAVTVLTDFGKQFTPARLQLIHDPDKSVWIFPADRFYDDVNNPNPAQLVREYGTGEPTIVPAISEFLRGYQVVAFLTGLIPLLILVGGAVMLVMRRHHRLAPTLWLLLSAAVMVMLVPAATVMFSWRYVLPTLVLYPPAGAVAWTMWREE